jgi:tetratricopeptide (TPR) repeat protein
VVLVEGEPGIGKTRLVEEIALANAAELQTVWGRCSEADAAPAFWPWVEVVRALVERAEPQEVSAALGAGAEDIAQVVPEVKAFAAAGQPPKLHDPQAARFRLYDAISRFLLRMAHVRPLLLVLEDLHWADVPSLELLVFLAPRLKNTSIAIVSTYRDADAVPPQPLAAAVADLAREPVVSRIRLGGLSEGEVGRLIAETTGAQPDTGLARALHARTDGNPFFVAELLRLLDSEAHPSGSDAAPLGEIPYGVRDVVARRVARLPVESAHLLRLAAVVGRDFDIEVLAPLGDLDEDRALDLLQPAVRSRVVAESPERVGRYRFAHAIVQEALYDELPALARVRLHCRLGELLEDLQGGDDTRLLEIAHHFFRGAPAASAEKALSYLVRAAEQAIARLAYEQAEHQLRRALRVLEGIPAGSERDRRELGIQLQLGRLLAQTKGYAFFGVGEAYGRARELCQQVEDAEVALPSLLGLAAFFIVRADLRASEDVGEQLVELGERLGHPGFLVAGRWDLGMNALHRGQLVVARDHLEHAVALSDLAPTTLRLEAFHQHPGVICRDFAAWAHCLLGDPGRARDLIQEAIVLAERLADPFEMAFALFFDAWLAVLLRDGAEARRCGETALALCAEHGFGLLGAMAGVLEGWGVAEQGEAEAGVVKIEKALAAHEATGARMLRHFFLALLAEAQWRAGRPEDALASVDEALAECDRSGERFYEAELHRLKGELLRSVEPDGFGKAVACFSQALSVAERQQARSLAARAEESLRQIGQ